MIFRVIHRGIWLLYKVMLYDYNKDMTRPEINGMVRSLAFRPGIIEAMSAAMIPINATGHESQPLDQKKNAMVAKAHRKARLPSSVLSLLAKILFFP